ncbi:PaREP1 family protein [Vulcanisaeta sp. JCM 16161]|uniref:PaREP1 family protein n=1 Tax=Vulcanisaeta sp. JCM 16161 TaxID=1295372 RepID=UPI0006D087D6|nr:PaREP1 family protein [Vulcanisaeta sp. JCM 16161]
MHGLPKPWFDIDGYKRTRLLETKYEIELAKRFLDEGLIRNAAGKAFQAVKALLAALAVDIRDKLIARYPGKVRIKGGKTVDRAYWVIAVMPTNYMLGLSALINEEIHYLAAIALHLHQYQYNGPDREGILSQYRTDDEAKEDILLIINNVSKILSKLNI